MTMSLMHSSSSPALPPPDPATPRALIADDQPDVLEALRLLLKGEGYKIETANAPAAIIDALASLDLAYPKVDNL